jgi:hypothetical protein
MSVPYKWTKAIHFFAHGDNYDLDAFKGLTTAPTEWAKQIQNEFEEILRTRPIDTKWYLEHANADFRDDEELYRYLIQMYDFLFSAGPYPETED